MRLQNYLTEIFDTKVDIKVITSSKITFSATFTVDDIKYQFDAENLKSTGADIKQYWDVTFRRFGAVFQSPFDAVGNLETKEVLSVFSAVKTAMLIFLKKYKPETWLFSAKEKESSRVKLYDKFAKIIVAKTKYKLEKSSQAHWLDNAVDIRYVFRK
jgi:hypothetical protein